MTTTVIVHANVCAVNSIVAELRRNGIQIACRVSAGVYFYRIGAT